MFKDRKYFLNVSTDLNFVNQAVQRLDRPTLRAHETTPCQVTVGEHFAPTPGSLGKCTSDTRCEQSEADLTSLTLLPYGKKKGITFKIFDGLVNSAKSNLWLCTGKAIIPQTLRSGI